MIIPLRWRKYIAVAVFAVPMHIVAPAVLPVITGIGLANVAEASLAPASSAGADRTALAFPGMQSVDVMKYTKDVMTSQPSDEEIEGVISLVKRAGASYIALSIPLDATSDYPQGNTPAPRTAEAFTQAWADAAHSAGLGIIWRGTFSAIEGIYGFEKATGGRRLPADAWLAKVRAYIANHSSYFRAGDVWAPLPERTEGIFSDDTSFLPHDGRGVQASYADFFNDLKKVSDEAFASIGVPALTGLTANNYTEIVSGWLPQSIFDSAGYVAVDYYGNDHSPAEMERDIRAMARAKGKPVFLQEWGDYWNAGMSESGRVAYLKEIYAVIRKLAEEGVLVGFNYWGGWDNAAEGILSRTGSGFDLNYRGTMLKDLFAPNVADAQELAPEPVLAPARSPSTPPVGSVSATDEAIDGTYCSAAGDERFTGCYYGDRDMRSFLFARADKSIAFRWNDGSPSEKVPNDMFAARWQGYFTFPGGRQAFTFSADDGVRLRIDNQLVFDEWHDKAAVPKTVTVDLAPGKHYIEMEYYEAYGGAVAELKWE